MHAAVPYTALILLITTVYAHTLSPQVAVSDLVKAQQERFYNNKTGLWDPKTGWWNCANALEAISEYMMYSKDMSYVDVVANVYAKTTIPETLNDYFDDQQWWAIAWLRAFQLTGKEEYLERSVIIWNYVVTHAWDNTCGGGVWWSRAKNYKNAITNELFFSLCMGLYKIDKNVTYLNWAVNEWRWFESSGMLNSDSLINDGLTSNCKNNNGVTWTYNQGVILGGLSELAQATQNGTMTHIAENIALAVLSKLVYPNGVLQDACDKNGCDGDSLQFKGVFVRYLGIFTAYLPQSNPNRKKFSDWLQLNANSILANDRDANNLCGYLWIGPVKGTLCATTQTAAIDCLNAVLHVTS